MRPMTLLSRVEAARPRLLDGYIVREMLPPTGIGLLVFTFVLLIDQIPRLLAVLVARSADLSTILKVFLNLLPSILAVTIPMAFLLGVLLAFGRMASDSEIVALRAVGVSPSRLLAPVMMLATTMTALSFYINSVALPAANQMHRQLVFDLLVSKARTDIRPRAFSDTLTAMIVYVQDMDPRSGVWKNLLIHDNRDPREPKLILACTGDLVIDKSTHSVRLELGPGSEHTFNTTDPKQYSRTSFRSMGFDLPVDEFFPDRKKLLLQKGDREMTLRELSAQVRTLRAQRKPRLEWARFDVEWHKKFAIPGACLVFGLLGLSLSLGSRKEARSSAFALSIAVIFVYYVLIRLGEQAGDTGLMAPWLSMWGANLVLGAMAVVLLWLNHREAAFDPLDPAHYLGWLPRVKRRQSRAARPQPAVRRGKPVVVVRIPRLTLRFPSILDRYIASAWTANVALVLVAFCAIYFLGELIDLIDDVQQNRVQGKYVFLYYAYHLWWIAFTVAPVAVLVGVLVTLGVLARRNEITAMKAGGVSVYRAAGPVLGMGLLGSLLLYGMQEWVLPRTNKQAASYHNVIKGRPAQSSDQFDRRWVLASDERFYNFDYIVEPARSARRGLAERCGRGGDYSPTTFYGFSIYDVDPRSWELRERVYTTRAAWDPASCSYELGRGWRRTTGPRPAFHPFDSQRVRAIGADPGGEIEPPSYFKREEKPADTMSFGELQAYIASLESRGFDVAKHKVQLHRKLAFPMVSLVMTVLAVPFSFVVARKGALYGIGIAIVIAIVYWAVLGIFEALGASAWLHPALAAWAPNLLFGVTGLYLILTLDT
jgi:LPS export ABC transporter permease LptF/LPS export ABC transporter permease LptG